MEDYSYQKPEDNPNFSSSSFARYLVSSMEGMFVCDYLYKLYLKKHNSDKLKIIKTLAIPSLTSLISSKPLVNYNENNDSYVFEDTMIMFTALYEDCEYEISFVKEVSQSHMANGVEIEYYLNISGTTAQSSRSKELSKFIVSESQRNSILRNKTLTFNLLGEEYDPSKFLKYFEIVKPSSMTLDDIFIPKIKKEQFERFIYSVKNFSEDHIGLRYLLNGLPGTGKTQLMKAIIRELYNDITIIMTQGGSFPITSIFEFCKFFEPCILIIDDVDFLIGDRDRSFTQPLGTFLQFLDGFVPNSLFLIASTNDKRLVDEAASRPGRFDVILDIGEIDPQNYKDLILRETSDTSIIQLFDESVLDELRFRKVTGAFIVSLIKQLKSIKKMKGKISNDDFRSYIDVIYKGFYGNNSENYSSAIGF